MAPGAWRRGCRRGDAHTEASGCIFRPEIREGCCQSLKLFPRFHVAGDGADAGERLNLPEHGAAAIVIFTSLKRVDEQSFLAVGTQARVGDERNAKFSRTGQQIHDFRRETLQRRQISGPGTGDEHDVEVGAVIQFRAAQLAEAEDNERRGFELVFAQHDFEPVAQARIGKGGKFSEVLLEVRQTENVAQADAHQLGLVVTPQPEALVFVVAAVAQILQNLFSRFAPTQPAAQLQFVHQVRRANGGFREELRAVEQPQQQFEQR